MQGMTRVVTIDDKQPTKLLEANPLRVGFRLEVQTAAGIISLNTNRLSLASGHGVVFGQPYANYDDTTAIRELWAVAISPAAVELHVVEHLYGA